MELHPLLSVDSRARLVSRSLIDTITVYIVVEDLLRVGPINIDILIKYVGNLLKCPVLIGNVILVGQFNT